MAMLNLPRLSASALIFLLGASLPLFGFAQSAQTEKKGSLNERIERLYESHAYAEVIPLLLEQYKGDSTSAASKLCLTRLANSHKQTGQLPQAMQWQNVLCKRNPSDAEAQYELGLLRKMAGDYNGAAEAFQSYEKLAPNDKRALVQIQGALEAKRLALAQPQFEIASIQKINSSLADYAPARFRDGILFVSTRPSDGNKKPSARTGQPFGDIYYSRTEDLATFENPEAFSFTVNTLAEEGPLCVDSTYRILYLTRAQEERKNPDLSNPAQNVLKILRAENINDYWTNFREMPMNALGYNCGHPFLSADGKLFFFASDRPGGLGGTDIWVMPRVGDSWGTPVNAGPEVNTAGNELFPYFHFDSTLYFASDLRPGLGGLDIFSAKRTPGKWSPAQNLGSVINSSYDDYGILVSRQGDRGLFSSNRPGGMGSDDIYLFYRKGTPAPIVQAPDAPLNAEAPKPKPLPVEAVSTARPTQVAKPIARVAATVPTPPQPKEATVSGVVLRKRFPMEAEQPVVGAKIELQDVARSTQMTYTDSLGRFSFRLPDSAQRNYRLYASRKGYENTDLSLRIDPGSRQALGVQVDMPQIPIGIRYVRFPAIYFETEQATIDPSQYGKLDTIYRFLVSYPELLVEVRGHTDIRGKVSLNQPLSIQRAQAVAQALKKLGLNAQRISRVYGFANTQSEYPEPENRAELARNRRSEIIVSGVK
jgi:outer membrane protein OmpA-like peptidoglycan-associated protein/tetratricopeptide (TPR) repeat protein